MERNEEVRESNLEQEFYNWKQDLPLFIGLGAAIYAKLHKKPTVFKHLNSPFPIIAYGAWQVSPIAGLVSIAYVLSSKF